MSAEQDAGKSGKKLISMIGFGTLIVLTGGYWLVTQPATGETYPKSDLFNKASLRLT
ncbi:hypothetical protein H9S86_24990 [Leclercia adecarboxylata]|uniref:hypothetical protein n=1 Tax=Leclercia adecarboxylata TaxID=83655 RepID=UPI0018627841|nr:hypothetical protein [Leclercia adecarboxylata]QNP33702.1 hypothetical protein H9S86_24990 [Leclercia adecarboxylata]